MRDRKKATSVSLLLWAAIILVGLAFLSVASGVAPVVEPAIFISP
jgi:hypothetical protein